MRSLHLIGPHPPQRLPRTAPTRGNTCQIRQKTVGTVKQHGDVDFIGSSSFDDSQTVTKRAYAPAKTDAKLRLAFCPSVVPSMSLGGNPPSWRGRVCRDRTRVGPKTSAPD